MAQTKNNAVRKQPVNEDAQRAIAEDISVADYADNMFRDGNNRVSHLKNAKDYDDAAHNEEGKGDAAYGNAEEAELLLDSNVDAPDEAMPEKLLALKQDTSRSRDGTDASGSLDESGGFLGGETQEVDDLEASAMPVDKIPHMND